MRNKAFRTLLAALLIASTMTATAFAETATVTGSEVNVRSGPGASYAILGSYSRGSSVEVVDRSNPAWYAVDYYGTLGYMSSDYLSVQEENNFTVVSSPSGQAVLDVGQAVVSNPAQAVMQTNGQITGMYVRFRSGPSSTSAILGEYNNGKAITILGTEGDWTLCYIDGQYGYIFSQYVSGSAAAVSATPAPAATSVPVIVFQDSSSAVPITQAPAGGPNIVLITPAPTAAPTPIPAVSVPGTAVLVTPTPAPAPGGVTLSGTPGVIVGDYVRFRRGPGTGYSIIGSYDRGQDITVLGTEGDWTYCRIGAETGYVFSQYVQVGATEEAVPGVSPGGQTVLDPAGTVVVQPVGVQTPVAATPVPTSAVGSPGYIRGNNVRFRAGPDLSSQILKELFYGNAVTITGSDGTWTSLIYEGQAGYVFSKYVQSGSFQNVSTGGTASGREIADYALQFLGTPYSWGGVDPKTGFDCSGFAYYVYKHFGYTLNRVAAEQALNGRHIDASELQPGDLLCFYSGGSYIGHVGIYVGSNMFVHAATSTTGVITSELTGYYAKRGFEARRILG